MDLRYVLQAVGLQVLRGNLFGFFLFFLLLVAVVVLASKAAEPDGANADGKHGEDGESNGQPDDPKPGGWRRLVKGHSVGSNSFAILAVLHEPPWFGGSRQFSGGGCGGGGSRGRGGRGRGGRNGGELVLAQVPVGERAASICPFELLRAHIL